MLTKSGTVSERCMWQVREINVKGEKYSNVLVFQSDVRVKPELQ